jgi:hypothetical protein
MVEERKILKQEPKKSVQLNMLPKEDDIRAIQYDDPEVVKMVEDMYPETTDEFKAIMFTQYELFCKKQLNYGPGNISVGTSLETKEDVKLSLTGLWFRMTDKINRLKQLVVLGQSDKVGESINDTYQDLSVYSIIAQIVNNGKWAK